MRPPSGQVSVEVVEVVVEVVVEEVVDLVVVVVEGHRITMEWASEEELRIFMSLRYDFDSEMY